MQQRMELTTHEVAWLLGVPFGRVHAFIQDCKLHARRLPNGYLLIGAAQLDGRIDPSKVSALRALLNDEVRLHRLPSRPILREFIEDRTWPAPGWILNRALHTALRQFGREAADFPGMRAQLGAALARAGYPSTQRHRDFTHDGIGLRPEGMPRADARDELLPFEQDICGSDGDLRRFVLERALVIRAPTDVERFVRLKCDRDINACAPAGPLYDLYAAWAAQHGAAALSARAFAFQLHALGFSRVQTPAPWRSGRLGLRIRPDVLPDIAASAWPGRYRVQARLDT
jgi:hypothetical protein